MSQLTDWVPQGDADITMVVPVAPEAVERDADFIKALRPYCIARVSGVPVHEVEALCAPCTVSMCRTVVALDAKLVVARESLTAVLFRAVGRAATKRLRNQLLEIRRDLFNLRTPRAAAMLTAAHELPSEEWAVVRDFQAQMEERSSTRAKLALTYEASLRDSRRRFQRALDDEDFRRGLAVSSPTLSLNLEKYQRTEVDRFTARAEQLERGLLRYFTRTAMKATPFATLCGVLAGRFELPDEHDHVAPSRLLGRPRVKRALVRLNRSLFSVLWTHLKSRPSIRAELFIELTPSLTIDEEALRFLTVVDSREVFQRLPRNEALDQIVPVLRDPSGTRLRHLVRRLCEDPEVDASVEEATAYIDQLLSIGLLRLRRGIPEQEADWDGPFAAMLDVIDDDHARLVADLLRGLRVSIEEYGAAPSVRRDVIARDIRSRLATAYDALGIRNRPRSDLPFYEDAAADAELRVTLNDDVTDAVRCLAEFVEFMLPITGPRNDQATMRHFFDQRYGPGGVAVPLLQFYEHYYREHFKTHLERQLLVYSAGGRATLGDYDLGNPFKLDVIKNRLAALQAIVELVRATWHENEDAAEIILTRDALARAMAGVDQLAPRERSVSLFCQLDAPARRRADGSPSTRFVLPNGMFFTGRGKYFSRFLYLLPPEFLAEVYADNNATESEWLAEICADADFNANLHSRLLRWEIGYPTAEGTGLDGQLLSADLDVIRCPDDPHSLRLLHRPTGMLVAPFDLGFLNPTMRPPLFQLLSRFTPNGSFGLPLPDSLSEPLSPAPSGTAPEPAGDAANTSPLPDHAPQIRYRPRITYEGRVVVARRRWAVPHTLFPTRQAAEGDSDYFLRVHGWRHDHGIPEQVYVRVRPWAASQTGHVIAGLAPGDSEASPLEKSAIIAATIGTESVERLEDTTSDVVAQLTGDEETDASVVTDDDAIDSAPAASPAKAGPVARTGHSRDWHKPQFIDFASPLLVKLFAHFPNALSRFTMLIEERLPDVDGLPDAGAERFATELVLQLDFPASRCVARLDQTKAS